MPKNLFPQSILLLAFMMLWGNASQATDSSVACEPALALSQKIPHKPFRRTKDCPYDIPCGLIVNAESVDWNAYKLENKWDLKWPDISVFVKFYIRKDEPFNKYGMLYQLQSGEKELILVSEEPHRIPPVFTTPKSKATYRFLALLINHGGNGWNSPAWRIISLEPRNLFSVLGEVSRAEKTASGRIDLFDINALAECLWFSCADSAHAPHIYFRPEGNRLRVETLRVRKLYQQELEEIHQWFTSLEFNDTSLLHLTLRLFLCTLVLEGQESALDAFFDHIGPEPLDIRYGPQGLTVKQMREALLGLSNSHYVKKWEIPLKN